MMRLRSAASDPVVEIEVDGRVTRPDVKRVFAEIEAGLKDHARLKVLEDIHSLDGIEPAARALSEVTRPFVPAQVRTFPSEKLAAARAWLAAA